MSVPRISIAILIVILACLVFLSPSIPVSATNNKIAPAKEEIPALNSYPQKLDPFQQTPPISASSAVVIDAKTGVTLFEKDPLARLLPASTVKLMTALVALQKCSPEKLVTIGDVEKEPNVMGLQTGDVISVKNLLYGLLVFSANDAALALSYSCDTTTQDFVNEMNLKARELQMKSTHFTNPIGFDSEGEFTTAKDLAKLAKVAVANPLIAKIVATKQTVVTDATGQKTYFLQNINELLGQVAGVEGVKTGETKGSLQVLITQTTREGNTIIVVVLSSADRFADSKQLIEWAFANHKWTKP